MIAKWCVSLSLLLVLASAAHARDLYVNNVAGNDLFDGSTPTSGGSASGPCRTIGRALDVARKGDRIVIANTGQPYRESITLQAGRHSGLANLPFEVIGNGAILEGAFPVPPAAWQHVIGDIYKFAPRLKSFQLLFLDGKPADRVAVEPGDTRLPELKPMQWCLFEREIYFRTEPDHTPHAYDLSYCGYTVGVTLYEVRHVRISGIIVQGFQLDGINAHDGARDVTLENVTCRGNARSGISVGGASQVRIVDSLIGNNGAAQLRTEGQSHTHVINTFLLDNTAPPLDQRGGKVQIENPPEQNAGGRRKSTLR